MPILMGIQCITLKQFFVFLVSISIFEKNTNLSPSNILLRYTQLCFQSARGFYSLKEIKHSDKSFQRKRNTSSCSSIFPHVKLLSFNATKHRKHLVCHRGFARYQKQIWISDITPVLKELSTPWERKTNKWLIPLHSGRWYRAEKFQMLLDLTEGAARSSCSLQGSVLHQNVSKTNVKINHLGFQLHCTV